MDLDRFDLRILRAVQRDGDLTQAKLAEIVHLSASQCARRLDRLRAEGYIEQTIAVLNRERLGLSILAHVFVGLREHSRDGNNTLQSFIRDTPEILECYMQSGDVDLLLKVVVHDLAELADLIDRIIGVTGGANAIRSSIVLRTIKVTNELPVSES